MEPIRIDAFDDPRVAQFRDIPDPLRLRERGTFVAEGRLAVRRLLAARRFTTRALLVTDAALAALADELASLDSNLTVFVSSRPLMRQIGGYDFHQGCLGLAERPEPEDPVALLERTGTDRPIVILEDVGNPDNVGGIFRNAAALGAAAVLLSPGCCDPLYRKSVRTSIGASLHVPFAVVDSWPAGLTTVSQRGFDLVALTPHTEAPHLSQYRVPQGCSGVALMLGNEGDGLTPAALDVAHRRVRIPIEPPVDALNVATAAALALYHVRGLLAPAERLRI